jgi:hypothetical protein
MARRPAAIPAAEASSNPNAPGYVPTYTDFVHLALIADLKAYLADAENAGLAYIAATADERECKRDHDVIASGDEFKIRDLRAEAARRFREVAGTVDTWPRRFEIDIETTYQLDSYDFNRKGFPFSNFQNAAAAQPILAPGVVKLPSGERPVWCNGLALGINPRFGSGSANPKFTDLQAEHQGAPGITLSPMSAEQGSAFRGTGKRTVVLRARLVVEPTPVAPLPTWSSRPTTVCVWTRPRPCRRTRPRGC